MRLHLTVVCYLAMFMTCVLVDETLGDQGPSTTNQNRASDKKPGVVDVCHVHPREAHLTREELLWAQPADFLFPPGLEQRDSNTTSAEEYREMFSQFCATKSEQRERFAELTNVSATCLNQTQQEWFAIHLANNDACLEVVCEREGELMAVAVSELKGIKTDAFVCVELVEVVKLKKDATIFNKNYQQVLATKQCVLDLGKNHEGVGKGVDAAKQLLDKLLSKMKCISPESGEVALCSGLGIAAE